MDGVGGGGGSTGKGGNGGTRFPFLCVILSGDESDSEAIQLLFETEEHFCLDWNFPSLSSSSLESMYF
jgi:hypothetical protein